MIRRGAKVQGVGGGTKIDLSTLANLLYVDCRIYRHIVFAFRHASDPMNTAGLTIRGSKNVEMGTLMSLAIYFQAGTILKALPMLFVASRTSEVKM
jgi:hypothetical protein